VKEYANTEETSFKLTSGDKWPEIHQMLPTITPAGMSAERQHYLYEKIRPFCSSEEAAALTCPRPASQPVGRTTQLPESKIKTTRKCSHCHKPGHTKTV